VTFCDWVCAGAIDTLSNVPSFHHQHASSYVRTTTTKTTSTNEFSPPTTTTTTMTTSPLYDHSPSPPLPSPSPSFPRILLHSPFIWSLRAFPRPRTARCQRSYLLSVITGRPDRGFVTMAHPIKKHTPRFGDGPRVESDSDKGIPNTSHSACPPRRKRIKYKEFGKGTGIKEDIDVWVTSDLPGGTRLLSWLHLSPMKVRKPSMHFFRFEFIANFYTGKPSLARQRRRRGRRRGR
jgi:hypothetical protein